MNEDAVEKLLAEWGIVLPAGRVAAIAADIAALGPRLAAAPRPTFDDEPASFQARGRKASGP